MTRGGVTWVALGLLLVAGCGAPAGGPTDGGGQQDGGGQVDGGSPGTPAPQCTTVQGTRDLALIPVTMGTDASPCSPSSLDTTFHSGSPSVASFWDLASAGRVAITDTVEPGVTIGAQSGCIGTNQQQNHQLMQTIAQQVDAQLTNIPAATTRVYLLPTSVMCGGAGPKASTQPPANRMFIFGDACSSVIITSHETGHLLGLNHSDTYNPQGQPVEYGDISDIMGHCPAVEPPNGPHRWQQGWVPAGSAITLDKSVASLPLAPLGDDASSLPQLVRIVSPSDATQAIYVSYRVASGIDATLDASFAGRTSIHSFVADCVAPGTTPVPKTFLLSTVGNGGSYTVSGDGIVVKQISSDGNGAVVSITIP